MTRQEVVSATHIDTESLPKTWMAMNLTTQGKLLLHISSNVSSNPSPFSFCTDKSDGFAMGLHMFPPKGDHITSKRIIVRFSSTSRVGIQE